MHTVRLRNFIVPIAVTLLLALGVPSSAAPNSRQKPKLDSALIAVLEKARATVPVVVQFTSPPGAADAKTLKRAGFNPPFVRYSIIPAVYAVGTPSAIRRLARQPRVKYIEYDSKIPYALDRAVEAGRASAAWDATYRILDAIHTNGITGRGIGVAIVDSGVDATHPDLLWKPAADRLGLEARTVTNLKLIGGTVGSPIVGDFVEADSVAVDMADTDTTSGHGTHVAGIVGGSGAASEGKYKGAAPGAHLIGLGVGETLFVVTHLALAAFDWIHRNHKAFNIRVVNNSWGEVGDWNPDLSITKAARTLVNEDKLAVVFAAGNSGGNGSNIRTNVYGNIPEVIQVANYYDRTGWVDSSSSRGDKKLERTWPHVAAPGTEIISAAANGKPVTYVFSGQDALINILFKYGEPNVLPAPLLEPVEANVAGHDVMAGNYASLTGTSMSSPFVAGVVALMLEANPLLDPFTVRQILRDTANMPEGRAYGTDGFAIGKGVVDAAEAVAVALRLREGKSYDDALRTALVEEGTPARINTRLPRMVDITLPSEGSTISGAITVEGGYSAGPLTSAAIPLAPPPLSSVTAQPAIYHRGFGPANSPVTVEPFLLTGGHTVIPGENLVLRLLSIESAKKSIRVEFGHFSATHRILQGDALRYGPFDAQVTQTASGELQSSNTWSVPFDASPGNYLFEGTITLDSGKSFVAARLPFAIGRPGFSPSSRSAFVRIPHFDLEGGSALRQTVALLDENFEGETSGWTVQQNGANHGRLTEWVRIDSNNSIVAAEPRSGTRAFYVGHRPGAEYANGYYYEDMADTSLISPEIDLSQVTSASLSYHRLGDSEPDYDFLRVFVAPSGSLNWTKIDEISGFDYYSEWNESDVSLSNFVGSKIRLRFQFVSDELTDDLFGGWYIDDVKVVGEAGSPQISIAPSLTATLTRGVGNLETSFTVSAESNTPVERLELDFGDGSEKFVSTTTAVADHEYQAGQWLARLTAFAGGASQSATLPIDVARPGRIELRVADRPWMDVAPAAAGAFKQGVDLEGMPHGPAAIEVRSCNANALCVFDRTAITVGPGAAQGEGARVSPAKPSQHGEVGVVSLEDDAAASSGEQPPSSPLRKPIDSNVTLGRTRDNVPAPLPWVALVLLGAGAAGVVYLLRRPKVH